MNKRQNYKEGAIVKIELANNKTAYGRLLPIYKIGIYDFILEKNNNDLSIAEIVNHRIIMYLGIYKQVVTRKEVEVIGYIPLSAEELAEIPDVFIQDKADFRKCTIYSRESKTGRDATPEECIGLEPFSIHPIKSLMARIEDYFAGRKNSDKELYKVILSEDDPRFLTAPHLLRWNFEKEVFEHKNE